VDKNYFNGIIGAEIKVCGYRLANLSLWHLAILEAIESPILTGENAGAREMLVLLKITQAQYPETPCLEPRFKDALWILRMERNPMLAMREVKKLRDWFEVQMSSPVLYKSLKKDKIKEHSSPQILSLVCSLVHKSNCSFEQAWNMRSAEARWYEISLAEQEGAELNISYENEEEEQQISKEEALKLAKKWLTKEEFESWNQS